MPLELQTATLDDCDELGQVLSKAYADEPTMKQLISKVEKPAEADAFWAAWLRSDMPMAGEKMFKIVDTETGATGGASSKIVAFNKVRYPAPMDHEEDFGPPPEGMNMELLGDWFEEMDNYHSKHMDPAKDMYAHVLAVLPEYHWKGLGGRLLSTSLEDADKNGRKTYLQATKKGESLYPRYGWKDLRDDCVFVTPEGKMTWKCMMREPQPKKV